MSHLFARRSCIINHILVLFVAFCLVFLPYSVQGFRRIRYRDILKEHQQQAEEGTINDVGGGHDNNDNDEETNDYDDIQELFFTQRLNHYDPTNTDTYLQRYFYTSRYTIPNAEYTVTFLCVGGEGPSLDKSVLLDSPHCSGDMLEVAKLLSSVYHWNVHVYALEHRYYGKSYPTFPGTGGDNTKDDILSSSPVATPNLKYLSSRQALEDLAHFVRTMSKQQKLQQQQEQQPSSEGFTTTTTSSSSSFSSPNNAWITFGGSYPGYLASLARLKYPHLVHAAVSNSAPLELKVDFPEYLDKLGWDLRYEKIGGSQQCFDIVKNGHQQAVAMLQEYDDHDDEPKTTTTTTKKTNSNQRQVLAEMFHVCNATTALENRKNQEVLVGDGLIEIYVQGNDPSCTEDLCNVEKLCSAMVTSYQSTNQTELEILADIARQQRGGGGGNDDDDNCVQVDWKTYLEALAEPTVTNGGWRSWLFQTCTEVGFYQTCQNETCPYASFYHLVEMDLEICQAAYNITPSQVYSNIQASLDHYGGVDTFAGGHGDHCDHSPSSGLDHGGGGGGWRRVLSVHGDVDPWSVLGLQPSASTHDMPVKMVAGASHHFWTHAVQESDAPEIVRIREYIAAVVLEWLHIDATTTPVSSMKHHPHQKEKD